MDRKEKERNTDLSRSHRNAPHFSKSLKNQSLAKIKFFHKLYLKKRSLFLLLILIIKNIYIFINFFRAFIIPRSCVSCVFCVYEYPYRTRVLLLLQKAKGNMRKTLRFTKNDGVLRLPVEKVTKTKTVTPAQTEAKSENPNATDCKVSFQESKIAKWLEIDSGFSPFTLLIIFNNCKSSLMNCVFFFLSFSVSVLNCSH